MAIKYKPSGTAELMGKLAMAAGEAEAAKQAQARAERERARAQELVAQRDRMQFEAVLGQRAQQMALENELMKMQQRSINDFMLEEKQHEMRVMYDMQKQLRERAEKDAKISKIKAAVGREITPEQASQMILEIESEIPVYSKGVLGARTVDPIKAAFAAAIGGAPGASATTPAPAEALPKPTTEAEYNALPPGSVYIHPTKGVLVKR